MGVLVALVATLPLLRSSEREELDAEARSRAPGAFVELSHGLVHYQVEGPEEGQPVLLVHGFSIPSYTWDRMAPVVAADGYRVIRFDLYGRGYSARPDVNYDRQLFVGQIDELLDALQVDRPIDIVGLSMGGPVVAAWASDHPDRVRRVVLLAPFNTPIDVGPVAVPILGEYLSAVFWLPSLPEGALDDFVEPRRFPDWADSFREQMRYEGFGRALLSTVRSFMQTDPISDFEALGRQSTPVLLIWGDQDRAVPFEQTGRVRSALGDAGFTPLTGAGHALHYEQAGRVNQKLLEFLSGP
jgi:pimeloyl-ACP methyl ester carboxylesterase